MNAVRYITVIGATEGEVEAYNYGHGILYVGRTNEKPAFILTVTAADNERAEYLANYQSERFASGLIGARVFTGLDSAITYLREYGVALDIDAEV